MSKHLEKKSTRRLQLKGPCVSRRRWLQKTAQIVGSGLSATLIPGFWTSLRAVARPSPNDRLRLAAIGVGNRGETNVLSFPDEQWVALCDVDRRYLRPMQSRFPQAAVYIDFRELMQHADLDGVVISTPDHTHYHAAKMALEKGLAVFCEKPLAHSIQEVQRLVKLAKETSAVTQTGMQHHASDGYRTAAEVIRSGMLGPIDAVDVWTNRPIWPQGESLLPEAGAIPADLDWDRWLGPVPPQPYHSTLHPMGWRGWQDFGCGALGDMGPHLLDPIFWALELDQPTHIAADSEPIPAGGFPKSSTIRFDFPARADRPAIRVTWYDGGRQPPPDRTGATRLPGNGALVFGERGRMFLPDYGNRPILQSKSAATPLRPPTPFLEKSPGIQREWTRAIREGTPVSCDFAYAARITTTCLLGNIALRLGQPLRWDVATQTFLENPAANQLLTRTYRADWP
jgi:predicted dehydrogenase